MTAARWPKFKTLRENLQLRQENAKLLKNEAFDQKMGRGGPRPQGLPLSKDRAQPLF